MRERVDRMLEAWFEMEEGRPAILKFLGTTPRKGKFVMAFDPLTAAGVIGSSLIIAAYFAIQQGWLSAEDWRYPLVNLIGAISILLSLVTAWNLPAAVIETFWAAISIYGLIKHRSRVG